MEISRRVDYGVRVMIEVAAAPADELVTIGALARRRLIPASFLKRIVPELVAAGLLRTQRGERGGVQLARPAETITLLQIVEALDGPIALNRCVLYPVECPLVNTCPAHEVWCQAQQDLRQRLDSARLTDLVTRAAELRHMTALGMAPAMTSGRTTGRTMGGSVDGDV
ncbi:MAG: Rrf2 family transcriptional regulator [Chloroflexi bacterium]|nr:Rrf2 family transcriptional regulator [Chloroflexota bacterium]